MIKFSVVIREISLEPRLRLFSAAAARRLAPQPRTLKRRLPSKFDDNLDVRLVDGIIVVTAPLGDVLEVLL